MAVQLIGGGQPEYHLERREYAPTHPIGVGGGSGRWGGGGGRYRNGARERGGCTEELGCRAALYEWKSRWGVEAYAEAYEELVGRVRAIREGEAREKRRAGRARRSKAGRAAMEGRAMDRVRHEGEGRAALRELEGWIRGQGRVPEVPGAGEAIKARMGVPSVPEGRSVLGGRPVGVYVGGGTRSEGRRLRGERQVYREGRWWTSVGAYEAHVAAEAARWEPIGLTR